LKAVPEVRKAVDCELIFPAQNLERQPVIFAQSGGVEAIEALHDRSPEFSVPLSMRVRDVRQMVRRDAEL